MGITLTQALLCALYYWFAWWGGMRPFWPVTWNATFNGMIIGIIMGDIKTGIIMGATIQTLYLAHIGGGGNLLSDQALASCVAIPIAMASGMDPELALTMATAFGLMGGLVDNTQRTLAGFIHRLCQKVVADMDDSRSLKKLFATGAGLNILLGLCIRFPFAFAIIYLAGSNGAEIFSFIPQFIITTFSTMGKMLPGVGMLMVATLIGRTNLLPFFVLGFFVMKSFSPTLLTMAIFGICLAFIYVELNKGEAKAAKTVTASNGNNVGKLSFAERAWVEIQLMTNYRMGICFEYLNGVGICLSLAPTLKKIYKEDTEGLKAALERHLQPYVSDVIIGGSIFGVVIAMEEQIAAGEDVDPELIVTLKSSLMGPMAGFGDSIIQTIVSPIIRVIFLPFALEGQIFGALMEPVVRIVCFTIGIFSFNLGYTSGRSAMTQLLRGGWLDELQKGAGVLGMFVLGAMASNYTKLALKVVWNVQGNEMNLQSILDGVLPGIVPFTFLAICWAYLYKGGKFGKLVLYIMLAALVMAVIGIV